MIMIIGGISQGKRAYANEHYIDADKHIFYLNEFLRKQFEDGADTDMLLEKILKADQELIIITDEIGSGIVPIEKKEREFRDFVGKIQVQLAKKADEVIRVICGIGMKIK